MLLYDCETMTPSGKPDPDKDELRFLGAYSFTTKQYYFYSHTQTKEIIELFKQHRIIIGHNVLKYDNPVLERAGVSTKHNFVLDTYAILKKRRGILGLENKSLSLENVAKHFKLATKKMEGFDYSLLNKTQNTQREVGLIKEYTLQDIKTTKEVFEHIYHFFKPFTEYINEHDKKTYKWLTSTLAVLGYKVLCNLCNIKEEYNDNPTTKPFKGAYVQKPTIDHAENVYYMDFASLYPHNMIQANLFSWNCKCCTEQEKWRGNELFDVEGAYCKKKLGKIEQTILNLYNLRQKYKKLGDSREYTIKIIINSLYGASGNPVFKNLFHYESAADTTRIGRRIIKLSIDIYKQNGYEVLYADTDSCFVKDNFNDKTRLLKTKDKIINTINQKLPFPQSTFDMKIDDEIDHVWFMKNGEAYNKKQYVYVTKQGKIKIKGLPMIKNDGSGIGLKIFNKYMKENLRHGMFKYDYEKVKNWVDAEISRNVLVCARKFKVYKTSTYKKTHQIQAQISLKYGAGTHSLIPNKRYGIGKGNVKYCTEKEYINEKVCKEDLVLSKMWKELKPFIKNFPVPKEKETRNKQRRLNKQQQKLLQWTNIGG